MQMSVSHESASTLLVVHWAHRGSKDLNVGGTIASAINGLGPIKLKTTLKLILV